MADRFTLQVDVAHLQAVEKTLGEIGVQCEEEGAKLAAMPGSATDWTGSTAGTLKTAMATLAADMRQAAPHFAAAATAVATFRRAVEQAVENLPGLNSSWSDSETTYAGKVAAANRTYDQAQESMPPQAFEADQRDLAATRAAATEDAQRDLATTQRWIGAAYSSMMTDLQTKAAACGTALQNAVRHSVPLDIVKQHVDGQDVGFSVDATSYLTGGSPFPSAVAAVQQSLVDRGVLPPECADLTLPELYAYLVAHPDVAATLAANTPQSGDPSSPESRLALLVASLDPDATGAAAESQRSRWRDFFETLSPQDQLLLATLFPTQTGNTGGVPFAARSAANHVTVIVAKQELLAKIAGLEAAKDQIDGSQPYISTDVLQDEIDALKKQLALYDGVISDPNRLIVLFDAQAGAFAEASGPIDGSTTDVAVIVPGTTTNMGTIQGNVDTYGSFADKSGGSLVTITWMGGPLPQSLVWDAPDASYSDDLAPKLAEFSKEVRQEITSSAAVDNDVKLTLAGHSYGGAVVGKAEVYGSDADRELFIEAAGMGNDVDSPDDQHPTNPDVKRYSMTAPGDPIALFQGADVGSLGLGPDPDTWPGTTQLETGYYADGTKVEGSDAHGGVFKRGSDSWQQMYEVMTGGTVTTWGANEPKQIYVAGGQGYGVWVDNPDYHPAQQVDVP